MASEWFYSVNGTRHGPVSSTELAKLAKSGKLKPTDLIWKEGMAEWQPAGRIRGLFPSAATPLAGPPSVATVACNDTQPGGHTTSRTSLGLWRLAAVWVAATATVAMSTGTCVGVMVNSKQAQREQKEREQRPQARANDTPKSLHDSDGDWQAFMVLNLGFAGVAAVTVCVLPFVCALVWPENSVQIGSTDLWVFLPESSPGWFAFYAATIGSSLCCCATIVAVIGLAFVAIGTVPRRCWNCGGGVPLMCKECPHCGVYNKGGFD